MDDIPFTKEDLSRYDAYTKTLPFAMDCMGHTEETWLDLLWSRVCLQRGTRVWTWNRQLEDGDIDVDGLLNWSRTPEGHRHWATIACVSGLVGFARPEQSEL